jgi:hypothetical protein
MCRILIFFSIIILFSSCAKELDTDATDRAKKQYQLNRSFYPLGVSNAWTYQIDSVYYTRSLSTIVRDTVTGIYRDSIADSSYDQNGKSVYRILHQRFTNSTDWETLKVFTITDDSLFLLMTLDNVSLVELVFPFARFTSWDPYTFTDKNRNFLIRTNRIQLYSNMLESVITDSVQTEILGQLTPMITVADGDFDDHLVSRQYSARTYGAGIGLVRKKQEFYSDQTTLDATVAWEQKAEAGFSMQMTLLHYHVR